jgi:energy-coupling factor transport system ATP-binding protein
MLEDIGLAVPQISYLIRELNARGFEIDADILTVQEAFEQLSLKLQRKKKSGDLC